MNKVVAQKRGQIFDSSVREDDEDEIDDASTYEDADDQRLLGVSNL